MSEIPIARGPRGQVSTMMYEILIECMRGSSWMFSLRPLKLAYSQRFIFLSMAQIPKGHGSEIMDVMIWRGCHDYRGSFSLCPLSLASLYLSLLFSMARVPHGGASKAWARHQGPSFTLLVVMT